MPTIKDIKDHMKQLEDLKVIVEGDTYLTVEDQEGYRAYAEFEVYGGTRHIGEENELMYHKEFKFATVHKPNKKSGTGYQYIVSLPMGTVDEVESAIRKTIVKSKEKIVSGSEQKCTRKPSESGKYLV